MSNVTYMLLDDTLMGIDVGCDMCGDWDNVSVGILGRTMQIRGGGRC